MLKNMKSIIFTDHGINFLALLLLVLLPVIAAALIAYCGCVVLDRSLAMTFVSIVTAIMCTTSVLVFQIRTTAFREDKRLVERDKLAINEAFTLNIWAIATGLVLAILLIIPDFSSGSYISETSIYAVVIAFLLLHFLGAICIFLQRFFWSFERIATKKPR